MFLLYIYFEVQIDSFEFTYRTNHLSTYNDNDITIKFLIKHNKYLQFFLYALKKITFLKFRIN